MEPILFYIYTSVLFKVELFCLLKVLDESRSSLANCVVLFESNFLAEKDLSL